MEENENETLYTKLFQENDTFIFYSNSVKSDGFVDIFVWLRAKGPLCIKVITATTVIAFLCLYFILYRQTTHFI